MAKKKITKTRAMNFLLIIRTYPQRVGREKLRLYLSDTVRTSHVLKKNLRPIFLCSVILAPQIKMINHCSPNAGIQGFERKDWIPANYLRG